MVQVYSFVQLTLLFHLGVILLYKNDWEARWLRGLRMYAYLKNGAILLKGKC